VVSGFYYFYDYPSDTLATSLYYYYDYQDHGIASTGLKLFKNYTREGQYITRVENSANFVNSFVNDADFRFRFVDPKLQPFYDYNKGVDFAEKAGCECQLALITIVVSEFSLGALSEWSNVNGPLRLTDGGVTLTQQQASNLARFIKKLPAGNTGATVDNLGDGFLFTSKVPGNVPGSCAIYQKSVDAAGDTTSFLKTTFDPDGHIIHIKDKLNGVVIPNE
jgi:hypothetical protein